MKVIFRRVFARCKDRGLRLAFAGTVIPLLLAGSALAAPLSDSAAPLPVSALTPPPSTVGVFPLADVHRGLMGTAWTVFEGTQPEPMQVEILGVLRGARGPGRDLILARLKGRKPEYTGVVAGMSGSPVYIDGKLLGALSYRIGQFSKEPIAGITPIAQMLEVRDLTPMASGDPNGDPRGGQGPTAAKQQRDESAQAPMQAMETPLLMSGFSADAIDLWRQRMAGTGLETIAAGGPLGSGATAAEKKEPILPGAAVSLQLVRGDMEIAATCTVTYVDRSHLLACGHPVFQSGDISVPMTRAEVVATLPSPLNAFKIINTGATIGAFTEDRDAAISGVLGAQARMIPVTMTVTTGAKTVTHHVDILNLPTMTASALLVSVYQMLLQTNLSTAQTTYHVTGEIHLAGLPPVPVDAWGAPATTMAPQLAAAIGVGSVFDQLYASPLRDAATEPIQSIALHVDALAGNRTTTLDSVRLLSSGIVHAGDTVTMEATIHRWQQPSRTVQLSAQIPVNLPPGTLRLLVSDGATLDRTLDATAPRKDHGGFAATVARLRVRHSADRLYLSLLLPEAEASLGGQVLDSIPLSLANALEPLHQSSAAGLLGESLEMAASKSIDGVLAGYQTIPVHVEAGGGLH